MVCATQATDVVAMATVIPRDTRTSIARELARFSKAFEEASTTFANLMAFLALRVAFHLTTTPLADLCAFIGLAIHVAALSNAILLAIFGIASHSAATSFVASLVTGAGSVAF